MAVMYFTQLAKKDENLFLMQDFVTWLMLQYNLEIKVIRLDNKMNRIKTRDWCSNVGILFKLCAPDLHTQNSGAKQFGRLIMEKTQAMRLSANLPHKLWREINSAATYLYNWTLRASNRWKSLYKLFYSYVFDKEKVFGPRNSQLHHLKAYRCKAYVLIKLKSNS